MAKGVDDCIRLLTELNQLASTMGVLNCADDINESHHYSTEWPEGTVVPDTNDAFAMPCDIYTMLASLATRHEEDHEFNELLLSEEDSSISSFEELRDSVLGLEFSQDHTAQPTSRIHSPDLDFGSQHIKDEAEDSATVDLMECSSNSYVSRYRFTPDNDVTSSNINNNTINNFGTEVWSREDASQTTRDESAAGGTPSVASIACRPEAVDALSKALSSINPNESNIEWLQSAQIQDRNRMWQEPNSTFRTNHGRRPAKKGGSVNSTMTKTGKKRKDHRPRSKPNRCTHLYEFIEEQLTTSSASRCVEWIDEPAREFRLTDTKGLAELWGKRKNSSKMSYDKMSRTLRYYQKLDILSKVAGKRLQFKFGNKCMWKKL